MRSTSRLRIWWLNPGWAFLLFLIPFCLLAYWTPASEYDVNWKTMKFFDSSDLLFAAGIVAAFLLGGFVAYFFSKKAPNTEWGKFTSMELETLTRVFWFGCILVSIAYAVWIAMAARSGVSLGMLKGLVTGEGTGNEIRDNSSNLPGITTGTQFAMAVSILAPIHVFNGRAKSVKLWMIGILFMTFLRSLVNSERLALVEVVMPSAVLVLFYCRDKIRFYVTGFPSILWPLAAAVLLYLLFTGSEYFRSWKSEYENTGEYSSVWAFSLERLTGYYVTALNNGSLVYSTLPTNQIPMTTFDFYWKFPIVGVVTYYFLPTHPVDLVPGEVLSLGANPEFNNMSAIFTYALDWGGYGTLIFFVIVGFIIFSSYFKFVNGSSTGLLTYPFLLVGISEISRVPYWSSARALPSWGLIFLAMTALKILRRSTRFRDNKILARARARALADSSAIKTLPDEVAIEKPVPLQIGMSNPNAR
jgi:hypothetical protein